MNAIADTHCHTVASGHAYSTVMELIQVAKQKGLYAIAITDHAKNMPAFVGKWHFKHLHCIPDFVDGVRVIKGIELDVIDHNGNTDDDPEETFRLEWRIASIHKYAYKGESDIEAVTNTWTEIARNPLINVIGHCELDNFKFDYDTVIPIFGEYGKLVEINNNSFTARKSSIQNLYTIAKLCKKHNVRVIVNSDAHFCTQVGECDNSLTLLKEIDFPEELIVNSKVEYFKAYLRERGINC